MPETATTNQTTHRAETDGIDLMQGESVLQNRRPGWSLWWKQIGFAALVLLAGVGGDAAGGAIVVSGLIFGYVVLSRMNSRYIVTDERVKLKRGLLSKKTREYRIPDLQSITTSQSIFERLLGHGSVEFRTADNTSVFWHSVPEYKDVSNTIREEQRKHE
jgi:uncharacterized membrane protein YdbT with pleckstrin-like domain